MAQHGSALPQSRVSLLPPRFVLAALTSLGLSFSAACDDHHDGESFDSLVECVDDHSSLTEAQAIAHCLVDFPELHGGLADQQACVDFVEANGGYPDSRDAACTDYFDHTNS